MRAHPTFDQVEEKGVMIDVEFRKHLGLPGTNDLA